MYSFKQKNGGYTMVEMLIYIFILALFAIVVVNTLLSLTGVFTRTKVERVVAEAGVSSMERISREIRGAYAIDESSNFGLDLADDSTKYLNLSSTDSIGAQKAVKFAVSGGRLRVYTNGIMEGSLTGSDVSVTNLVFRKITTTAGFAIKIEMTVSTEVNGITKEENFYDTVTLRGGY